MPKPHSRQSVVVKHISDQDVEHHISIVGAKARRRTRGTSNKLVSNLLNDTNTSNTKIDAVTPTKRSLDVHDEDMNNALMSLDKILPKKDVEQAEIDDEIGALPGDLYHFKTPKKSRQMTKFATESAKKMKNSQSRKEKENEEPSTPVKPHPQLKTPKKSLLKAVIGSTGNTPFKERDTPPTPVRKSKRIHSSQKFGVQQMIARLRDEEQSDESEESEEDEIDEVQSSETIRRNNGLDAPTTSELYFEAHKSAGSLAAVTSDRTMSRLKTSQITFNEMQTILERIEKDKADAVGKKTKGQSSISLELAIETSRLRLISRYKTYFRKWMFHISQGYNLMLFGFGSKRQLLNEFCVKMLSNQDKVIVNGYFPSLLVKSVLNSICDIIDDTSMTNGSKQNQVDAICDAYSGNDGPHLFLIVHNVDGVNLRNSKSQDILCRLSQCPRIHIVATIDHINATLIWDQITLIKFNWLWYDVTTYQWYKDETSYENSLSLLTSGAGTGGSLALSGLLHVTRSLTPNARAIFKLIVEIQIEEGNADGKTLLGISFSDLYRICGDKYLVHTELTLRTQLTEFLDHKLVVKKDVDGTERLIVPLDVPTMKEYLEQVE